MSYDSIRIAIEQKIMDVMTAYDPTILLEFENNEQKDMNKPETFVHCRLKFDDSNQIGMNTSAPGIRHWGEVQVYAMCKTGSGTKKVLEIAQAVTDGLKFQLLAGAQMQAPRMGRAVPIGDWYTLPVMTTFYTDAY